MPRLPPVTSAVRPASEIIAGSRDAQCRLDQLDDYVLEREMEDLDQAGLVGGHHDRLVYQGCQRPAAPAEECHGARAPGACRPRGGKQVGTLPTGAVEHQEIARAAVRVHLAGEDLVEAEVVAGR